MADKFISLNRLNTIVDWIKDKLSSKQDTLTEGHGINLNDGTISADEVFYATKDVTTAQELIAAFNDGKIIVLKQTIIDDTYPFVVAQFSAHNASHCSLVVYNVNGMTLSNGVTVMKYRVNDGTWTLEMQTIQNKLVSGTNIKTINNQSVLGEGNINIEGGGGDVFVATINETQANELLSAYYQNKIIVVIPSGKTSGYSMIVTGVAPFLDNSCVVTGIRQDSLFIKDAPLKQVEYSVATNVWLEQTRTIQNELVSGESIKTINNISLLGSGNIDIQGGGGSDVFIAQKGITPVQDVLDAWNNKKIILLYADSIDKYKIVAYARGYEDGLGPGGVFCYAVDDEYYPVYHLYPFEYDSATKTYSWGSDVPRQYLVRNEQLEDYALTSFVEEKTAQATADTLGTMKLNPSQSIGMDADGHLTVGGRLGQFPTSTGVYAPQTIKPAQVGDGSFLLTEASGTSLGSKSLAVTTGRNLTCRSAAAGSTQYRVQNTYINRIEAALLRISGGVVALNEADAKLGNFANVVSVKINNADFVPDSTPNNTAQAADIVITVDKTINPSAATTTIRVYPAELNFSTVHAGQGIGSSNGNGASVIVGQGVCSNSGNANNLVGASIYNQGNGNTVVGRQHISRKNRWFMSGTGHDNTDGKSESGAVFGEWANITSDTAFAIGNGTSHTARSNLFEIKTNGDVYLNGAKVLP